MGKAEEIIKFSVYKISKNLKEISGFYTYTYNG